MAVAERIRLAVRQLGLLHEGNEAGIVTISAGVSAFVPIRDVDAPDKLMRAADKAPVPGQGAGPRSPSAAAAICRPLPESGSG
jgi:GGDEF domain-containing protein